MSGYREPRGLVNVHTSAGKCTGNQAPLVVPNVRVSGRSKSAFVIVQPDALVARRKALAAFLARAAKGQVAGGGAAVYAEMERVGVQHLDAFTRRWVRACMRGHTHTHTHAHTRTHAHAHTRTHSHARSMGDPLQFDATFS